MIAPRPRHAIRPMLVTTAHLAFRYGLFHNAHAGVSPSSVRVVVPRAHPAVAARLRRIAAAFAARRPTTLYTVA